MGELKEIIHSPIPDRYVTQHYITCHFKTQTHLHQGRKVSQKWTEINFASKTWTSCLNSEQSPNHQTSSCIKNIQKTRRPSSDVQSVALRKILIHPPSSSSLSVHLCSPSSPMFLYSLWRSLNSHWHTLVTPHYWPRTHTCAHIFSVSEPASLFNVARADVLTVICSRESATGWNVILMLIS